MTAKSKRRRPRETTDEASPQIQPEQVGLPEPHPPRPNKRLLQVSAVLLFAWFCFLGWMALFN